jgi:hypothetical protein
MSLGSVHEDRPTFSSPQEHHRATGELSRSPIRIPSLASSPTRILIERHEGEAALIDHNPSSHRRPRPLPDTIPLKLARLHTAEEHLRSKALEVVAGDERLQLHLAVVEGTMDLADTLRQLDTNDEDLKVIQIFGMRTFNAFGASLKLVLSGYSQNSALVLRDVMETMFLIDYFAGDRSLISRWRLADKKARMKAFSPVKVREALDARDGFTEKKRFKDYETFSELAGHPSLKSHLMMRPQQGGDAVIGPFMEATTLDAVIFEMARMAIQVGEQLNLFFPADWQGALPSRLAFAKLKQRWIARFYPSGTI